MIERKQYRIEYTMPELDLENSSSQEVKRVVKVYEDKLIYENKCDTPFNINLVEKRISGAKTESDRELIDRLKKEGDDDYLILEVFLNVRDRFEKYKKINQTAREELLSGYYDPYDTPCFEKEQLSLSEFEKIFEVAKEKIKKLNSSEILICMDRNELWLEAEYTEPDEIVFSKVLAEMSYFTYKEKFTYEFYKSLEERFGYL